MAHLFVSYARADVDVVKSLVAEIRDLGHEPFYDQDLSGGQRWWDVLLDRIGSSAAFLPVLSDSYVRSEACGLEAAWAHSLGMPIIPIDLGKIRPELCDPYIAEANWVRYNLQDRASVTRLARALTNIPTWEKPATEPARPPVPITYLAATRQELRDSASMSGERQLAILTTLRAKLGSDEDASARSLLTELRRRPDVTYSIAVEIDDLLKSTKPPKRRAVPPVARADTEPEAMRRRRAGLVSAVVLVVAALVIAITWLVMRDGSHPRLATGAGGSHSVSPGSHSSPGSSGPMSNPMSSPMSNSMSNPISDPMSSPMSNPMSNMSTPVVRKTLSEALQSLGPTLLAWQKCHAMTSPNDIMCENPDAAGGASYAEFHTYPSLNALYDAYIAKVESESKAKFYENKRDCTPSVWSGEVSWNHNSQHLRKYTVEQMRHGQPADEDTGAAGRVFCVSMHSIMHIIWTQNAGNLLAEVIGAPAPATWRWWHTVHHNIAGLSMHMS